MDPVVTIIRVPPRNPLDELTHLAHIAEVEGMPRAYWRTRTVTMSSIVAGATTLEAEKELLRLDALADYHRWVALQNALEEPT